MKSDEWPLVGAVMFFVLVLSFSDVLSLFRNELDFCLFCGTGRQGVLPASVREITPLSEGDVLLIDDWRT